nr:hypothetical protein [Tanacetum cinerariifolium]
MTETMEQYMSKTRGNYGSGVVRPKINDKTHYELKGKYLKELHENTFSSSKHEDANEHIKKVLEIVDLFHIHEEVILLYNELNVPTRQIINSKGVIPTKIVADAKIAILEMAEYYQKWHNKTSSKTRRPGFYQRNNRNSSYLDRRQTLEESLTKFMAESAKRHKENSNIIKEIRASTDVAIRSQGESIKTLEIQIGQMSKVLQERGIRGLPGSTEANLRDHAKLISTAKAGSSKICRMRCIPYAVSGSQHRSIFFEIVPFPRRLQKYYYGDWRKAQDVKILEAYDHTLP